MKVITNFSKNYPEDPIRFFNFEEYEDQYRDCELYVGAWPSEVIRQESTRPKIFFSTEEQLHPQDGTNQFLPFVEKIVTICHPKFSKRQKREFAFFPLNESLVPEKQEKIYDCIYTGLATNDMIQKMIATMVKFNYCYVSFQSHSGVTAVNVDYLEKLKLIAQSTTCIVHNILGNNTPQLKSRPFEAAFCQSLMLCYKDDYNVIEDWFTPNEDFLYFSNEDELSVLISHARANPAFYDNIINNAYDKAMNNYTTKHFLDRYVK